MIGGADQPGGETATRDDRFLKRIESARPLAQSRLWELQRRYFSERGPDAWRLGQVPHHVTSNPAIAEAYAAITLAFLRDSEAARPDGGKLTIVELGGGSGRFAFNFLTRLARLAGEEDIEPHAIRYVLTDSEEANIAFWARHPRFAPFLADGRLELAQVDLLRPSSLTHRIGGETIEQGSLAGPLVIIANYVFDGVPQDLFRFEGGDARLGMVSLACEPWCDADDPISILAGLRYRIEDAPLDDPPYREPDLAALFEIYRAELDTYLLFPAAAIRGLREIAAWSRRGALLLSADKGQCRLAELDGNGPPALASHGSLSLPVNYHALAWICEAAGGAALLPDPGYRHLAVIGLLMLAEPERFRETRRAFSRHVVDFGPDERFRVMEHGAATAGSMPAEILFAFLRLSRGDPRQLQAFLPRLGALAAEWPEEKRIALATELEAIWSNHFPIGEDDGLAADIARLLYAIDDHEGALRFFARSTALNGSDTATLFNMAACHHLLGRDAMAERLLAEVIAHDPQNQPAQDLFDACRNRRAEPLAEPAQPGLAPTR